MYSRGRPHTRIFTLYVPASCRHLSLPGLRPATLARLEEVMVR
jgi:hypothetical protein